MIKTKKIIAGLMAFIMLCGVAYSDNGVISEMINTVLTSAEVADDSGLCGYNSNCTYTFESAIGTLTISGTGDMPNDDYDKPWEDYKKSIKSVVIEDGVTSVGWEVFSDCTSLTEVKIPDSVTSIGYMAFSGCTSLTEITISDFVTSIDELAFDGTPFLENQTTDVKYAGKWAVACNEDVTEVEIRPDTIGLADSAFNYCTSLTEVTIPDSVAYIERMAFYNCTSLTKVTIPDSVIMVGSHAFSETPFLENQTSDVKYAGKWAVDCNKDVTKVEIKPDTVGIAGDAFEGCTSLTSVTIPDFVISIGYRAFYGCESLTEITIPDSVTSIDDYAFAYCDSITVTIPNSVAIIGASAFLNCTSLTEVTIPDSVKNIGLWAFDGCTSLTSVTLPDSDISIAACAFHGCTSLTEVTIPPSVAFIGDWVFGYYLDETNYDYIKVENFTIYGVKGTAAESYAVENEFNFVEIESTSTETAGDVNGDGETTSSDALNVLQLVVGTAELTEEQKKIADLNGDGDITSADALYILQIVVGLR